MGRPAPQAPTAAAAAAAALIRRPATPAAFTRQALRPCLLLYQDTRCAVLSAAGLYQTVQVTHKSLLLLPGSPRAFWQCGWGVGLGSRLPSCWPGEQPLAFLLAR